MKMQVTIEEKDIRELIAAHFSEQGMALKSFHVEVEKGDQGDPREAGYRRAYISCEVEMSVGNGIARRTLGTC